MILQSVTTAYIIGVSVCKISAKTKMVGQSMPTHSPIETLSTLAMPFRNGKLTWRNGATNA